jgi:hypothetical protein
MKAIKTINDLRDAIASALNHAVDNSITISPLPLGMRGKKVTVDIPYPGTSIEYELDEDLFDAHKDVFDSVTPGFNNDYGCAISQRIVEELERRDLAEKRKLKLRALIE